MSNSLETKKGRKGSKQREQLMQRAGSMEHVAKYSLIHSCTRMVMAMACL